MERKVRHKAGEEGRRVERMSRAEYAYKSLELNGLL